MKDETTTLIIIGVLAYLYFTSNAKAAGGGSAASSPATGGGSTGTTSTTSNTGTMAFGTPSPNPISCPSGVHLLMNYHADSDTFDYTCGVASPGSDMSADMGLTQ